MTTARHMTMPIWLYALLMLVGCAAERNDAVPASAHQMTEGNGRVAFTAPRSGTVYVFDRNDDRVIYSGAVARAAMVVVAPDRDKGTVGDKTVNEKGLHRGNQYRIFFDESTPSVTDRDRAARNRDVDRDRD